MWSFRFALCFQELPEQWNNTKKIGITVKQQVAPLQANEVANIRKKSATFDVEQHKFREMFRKIGPFRFNCETPYEQLDTVGHVYSRQDWSSQYDVKHKSMCLSQKLLGGMFACILFFIYIWVVFPIYGMVNFWHEKGDDLDFTVTNEGSISDWSCTCCKKFYRIQLFKWVVPTHPWFCIHKYEVVIWFLNTTTLYHYILMYHTNSNLIFQNITSQHVKAN